MAKVPSKKKGSKTSSSSAIKLTKKAKRKSTPLVAKTRKTNTDLSTKVIFILIRVQFRWFN